MLLSTLDKIPFSYQGKAEDMSPWLLNQVSSFPNLPSSHLHPAPTVSVFLFPPGSSFPHNFITHHFQRSSQLPIFSLGPHPQSCCLLSTSIQFFMALYISLESFSLLMPCLSHNFPHTSFTELDHSKSPSGLHERSIESNFVTYRSQPDVPRNSKKMSQSNHPHLLLLS